jgi:hypothetical protein
MKRDRAIRVAMSAMMCLLLMMLILVNMIDGARWPLVPLH